MSEVEETLKRIQAHKGVIGIIVVNQEGTSLTFALLLHCYCTVIAHQTNSYTFHGEFFQAKKITVLKVSKNLSTSNEASNAWILFNHITAQVFPLEQL